MSEKKYKMMSEKITVMFEGAPHILHRIKTVRDFGEVKAGKKGGYIERESNLSHDGNCWVGDLAKAFDGASVSGDAQVIESAMVCGCTAVGENAIVGGHAIIKDHACVFGKAIVCGAAVVYERAAILGKSEVMDISMIHGNVKINGGAIISGSSNIY